MSKCYLHSVGVTGDIKDIDYSLIDLEGILKTGAILTRHARNLIGFGFNGTRYISLSDYDKRFNNIYKNDPTYYDYTAYQMYSTKAISILIAKDEIKAIKPTLVQPLDFSLTSMLRMYGAAYDIIRKRMSDLPDEVQVYGNIGEEAFRGITIPVRDIYREFDYRKLVLIYTKIKTLLEKYKYHMNIYDVETLEEIQSTSDLKDIIKRSI